MVKLRLMLLSLLAFSLPICTMEEGSRKRPAQDELVASDVKKQKSDKKALIAKHNLAQQLKDLRKKIDPEAGVVHNPQAFKDFVTLYKAHGLTLKDCVKAFLREKKEKAYQAIKKEFRLTDEEMQEILRYIKKMIKKCNKEYYNLNRAIVSNIDDGEILDYIEDRFFESKIPRNLYITAYNEEWAGYDDSYAVEICVDKKTLKNDELYISKSSKFAIEHELNHLKKYHVLQQFYLNNAFKRRLKKLKDRSVKGETNLVNLILDIASLDYKLMYFKSNQSISKLNRAKEIEADLLETIENTEIAEGYLLFSYQEILNQKNKGKTDKTTHPANQKRLLWARTILQLLKAEKELR